MPINSYRSALNETVITGDSGNPIFLILNGKPVIIGCFTYGGAGSGNALTHYANLSTGGSQPEQSINDLIVATDANAGINTGYKISFFDFLLTSSQPETAFSSANVYVKNKLLQIQLNDNSNHSQVMIFDGLGKLIKEQIITGTTYNFELTTTGMYVVRIINGTQLTTYKVFAF